jgi:hypothetical protein
VGKRGKRCANFRELKNRHFRQLYLSTGFLERRMPLCEQLLAREGHLNEGSIENGD